MSERNGCQGFCCEAFSLGHATVREIHDTIRRVDDEADLIIDMLVPIGSYDKNPANRCRDEREGTAELQPVPMGAQFFSCRHFDKAARSCGIYEKRPGMCRKFPNRGRCPFVGCDHAVFDLRESRRYPGAYFENVEGRTLELMAAALDCPEDPVYERGLLVSKALRACAEVE